MSVSLPEFDYGELLANDDPSTSQDEVRHRFAMLLERTESLFPGGVRVTLEEDSEVEGEFYLVLHVRGLAEFPVLSRCRREWYEACYELLGAHCRKLRLALEFER